MSNEKNEENLTDEIRAQMAEEVNALSPARRKVYGELIAKSEAPPAPDYANMSEGEFNKIRYGIK
jgi:hypothetical protein